MIQKLLDGVIKAIRTRYDKSYDICTESVEQGLMEPCFSVLSLNPSGQRETSNRFKRFYPFIITYFPATDEPVAECNEVCEELLELLTDINTEIGIFHAVDDMSGQVVDGNLQFSVQYQLFVRAVEENDDEMDEVTVNTTAV